jgi:hypothetical protein
VPTRPAAVQLARALGIPVIRERSSSRVERLGRRYDPGVKQPDFHDATLLSLELRWSSGDAVIRIRPAGADHSDRVIVVTGVRRLECDRRMPWGPSTSINEVRGPVSNGAGLHVLEIEMQSGDVIRIEASTFTVRNDA